MKFSIIEGLCGLVALTASSIAAAQAVPMVGRMIVTQGLLNGRAVTIESLVVAPASVDMQTLQAKAVAEISSQGVDVMQDSFTASYSVWPQFFDKPHKNNRVTMYYNPGADPVPGVPAVFQAALAAWSAVPGSTFRYTFGGTTARQQVFGDGYNDVGFVRAAAPCDLYNTGCVLGRTYTAFDPTTAATTETDIQLYLYPNLPGMWSTDATVPYTFDIGSVLRHELGHAAGLGHTNVAGALMYPSVSLNEVEQITAAEVEGLTFLYSPKPTSLASTSTPSDKHNFNKLAESFTPAPGGGTYLDYFEIGRESVNKNGDVAFAADIDDYVESLLLADKSGVNRLLRPGQSVGGLVLGDHTLSWASLNDVGDIAVTWTTYPGDYRFPYGVDSAVLRKRTNGDFQPVVVPGVTAVPGGGWFRGALDLSLSQAGDVAFNGLVDSAFGLRAGVFIARGDGSIQSVAQPGYAAPGGGVFYNTGRVSISSQGDYVAFVGDTRAPGGRAIYLQDPRLGQLTRIAKVGDQALAGRGRIVGLTYPKVNAKGDVLFGARTFLPGEKYGYWVLYLYTGGKLSVVVRDGDTLADGRTFLSALPNSWSLTDGGDVVFEAIAKSIQYPINITGYYATWKGQSEYILRYPDNLLGGGTAMLTWGGAGSTIGNHGDIVFLTASYYSGPFLVRASRKVYTQ